MKDVFKIEPRLLKGFRDFSPEEQKLRQGMMTLVQSVFERFGFLPLSTPALEYKEILTNKYGDEEKLVYGFVDHGGREVALRYDLTVPLARFVAMNMGKLSLPFRRYQIAPVWRAENTQAGRRREFFQCDIDIVGTESYLADAEVMACLCGALKNLGISDFELNINDRKLFNVFFNEFNGTPEQVVSVIRAIDKLDKIGESGVTEYLSGKGISETGMEQVREYLSLKNEANIFSAIEKKYKEGGRLVESMSKLMSAVMNLGVKPENIKFNPFIARGLDYYTGVVFEIVLKGNANFGSIAGGGRYDSLVDQFSNKPLAAVGGSIGLDRIFEILESQGKLKAPVLVDCLVFNLDKTLEKEYMQLASEIRSFGVGCEFYLQTEKIDKQFKYAEAKNARYAVICGTEEFESGCVKLKDLNTREEKVVNRHDLGFSLGGLLKL